MRYRLRFRLKDVSYGTVLTEVMARPSTERGILSAPGDTRSARRSWRSRTASGRMRRLSRADRSGGPSMYDIDPSRLDLAREFRQRPFGLHGGELQAVLDRMRSMPIEGKHVLLVVKPNALWILARMQGEPLQPVPVPGVVFTDLEEAEWTVFKLRWQALTGHDLAAALGEPATPASPLSSPQITAPDPDRAILAYPDEISAAPGDKIAFKVSCLGIAS